MIHRKSCPVCITYISALLWETHFNNQDKSYLQLRVVHYSLYWIAQIHEPIMENLSTYKEPMTCIFYVTPNAPKSCTM